MSTTGRDNLPQNGDDAVPENAARTWWYALALVGVTAGGVWFGYWLSVILDLPSEFWLPGIVPACGIFLYWQTPRTVTHVAIVAAVGLATAVLAILAGAGVLLLAGTARVQDAGLVLEWTVLLAGLGLCALAAMWGGRWSCRRLGVPHVHPFYGRTGRAAARQD